LTGQAITCRQLFNKSDRQQNCGRITVSRHASTSNSPIVERSQGHPFLDFMCVWCFCFCFFGYRTFLVLVLHRFGFSPTQHWDSPDGARGTPVSYLLRFHFYQWSLCGCWRCSMFEAGALVTCLCRCFGFCFELANILHHRLGFRSCRGTPAGLLGTLIL